MKKIILLLLSFFIMQNANAYDLSESFYYNDEKVDNMWITKVKDGEIASGLPFILRTVSDNSYVYCLQPFIMLKQEENYQGYYEVNDKFNLSEIDLERIRLLAHFGYLYSGHEDIKWYGITQYLIWKTVDKEADIYFTDARYGNKINIYQNEISEIEYLINEYLGLLELNNQKFIFTDMEKFTKFKNSNMFLSDLTSELNQTINIFENSTNSREIFFYHSTGQNVYLQSSLRINSITLEIEFVKDIIIRKWYGSGKYDLEEGAIFEIYKNNELIDTVITDKYGIAYLSLPYGVYNIIQTKGIDGYSFINPFSITIDADKLNGLIEFYNEAEVIKVPNTSKNKSLLIAFIPALLFIKRYLC